MNTDKSNERRVQGGIPGWPPAGTVPPIPNFQLPVQGGIVLTDLEKEVIRLALNEYRFMMSHQINNTPAGHAPPTVMSMKFVDAIAAGLMERFKNGPSILDIEPVKPDSPIAQQDDLLHP